MFQSFTCTTKFVIDEEPTYAEEYSVKNYYGSLAFTRGSSNGTISELNKQDLLDKGPWTD